MTTTVNSAYPKAYTEVLEIISHFSKEDYSKIPSEKIEFYKENMDKNYDFKINPNIDLSEQNISVEANSIIVNLYLNYFATETQKTKINELLKSKQNKNEAKKMEKYNPDDIFKNSNEPKATTIETTAPLENSELPVVAPKENFFSKFINYIKKLFSKSK